MFPGARIFPLILSPSPSTVSIQVMVDLVLGKPYFVSLFVEGVLYGTSQACSRNKIIIKLILTLIGKE
jgi:hypothetical protein